MLWTSLLVGLAGVASAVPPQPRANTAPAFNANSAKQQAPAWARISKNAAAPPPPPAAGAPPPPLAAAAPKGPANPNCKAHPDTHSWPSEDAWQALNTTVGGALLQPYPAAAECHPKHPAYNPQICTFKKGKWNSAEFHSHHPTSTVFTNVNGYSCEILDTSRPCVGTGFPLYVLEATSPEQIAVAVKWANDHNVRLNVKSTGHDFLGRSTQPFSLSIWVHYLQDRTFSPKGFKPDGCSITIPGQAVTAGGGTQMGRLQTFAGRFGKKVIGGSSGTVSVGGYISGGGHSTISGRYGMAADAVYQVEVVTPAGDLKVANECQNQDLFWAVRGGGGGTFGVITKFTVAAVPKTDGVNWMGFINGPAGSDALWDALTAYHAAWAKYFYPMGITGYLVGNAWKSGSVRINLYGVDLDGKDDFNNAVAKVNAAAKAAGKGKVSVIGAPSWYSGAVENLLPGAGGYIAKDGPNPNSFSDTSFPGNGQNKIISSWLWSADDLSHPNMKEVLKASSDNETLLYQDFTAGPATAKSPFLRGGGNAVGPGWRSAAVRPAAELQWAGDDRSKLAERKAAAQRFTKAMKSINPSMGAYVNEADPEMPNAREAFWGVNYPKLYDIKRKYDPKGALWCSTCVGGEDWEVQEDGSLCKA